MSSKAVAWRTPSVGGMLGPGEYDIEVKKSQQLLIVFDEGTSPNSAIIANPDL